MTEFDSLECFVLGLDSASTIRFLNRYGVQRLDYSCLDDLIGKPVEVLLPEGRRELLHAFNATREGGPPRSIDDLLLDKQGQVIPVTGNVQLLGEGAASEPLVCFVGIDEKLGKPCTGLPRSIFQRVIEASVLLRTEN